MAIRVRDARFNAAPEQSSFYFWATQHTMEVQTTNGALTGDLDFSTAADARVASALVWDFKHAMRRLTAAVAIVATRERASRYGMTATALSPVSAEPPAMLVCINRSATLYASLMRAERFSVNVLHERQRDLVGPFSGMLPHGARFEFGAWRDINDLPTLEGAQATILCRVDGGMRYGSHDIVVGRVEAVEAFGSVAPLLWQDGGPAAARALLA